jgi:hypothetical protein
MQRARPKRDRTGTVDQGRDRPVFVLGAPRSGTSLLYKILCMHPEAAWISNWVRVAPWATALAALNRIPIRSPELQCRVWFGSDSNAYVYGTDRRSWERLVPQPVEGEPIFERIGSPDGGTNGAAGSSALDRELAVLRARLASIRRFSGGSVFVNKRIGNNRRVAQLRRCFPSARFVDVVRDGRAVAYSVSKVDWWSRTVPWWSDRTPERLEADGGSPWELCARSWVEEVRAIEQGLEGVASGQVFHISYEELITSPIASVRAVASFAGLPHDDEWLTRVGGLDFPNRNEAWRRRLGPAEIATIEEIQADTLRRHGYA